MRTQIPGKQILDEGVDTADIKDAAVTDEKLSATGIVGGTYTQVTVNEQGRVTAGANPTTLDGYGILDAISATDASAFPIVLHTPIEGFAGGRVLMGTANQVTITPQGEGNLIAALAANPIFPGTGAATMPSGTTAQRPDPATAGSIRYNTTTAALETPIGLAWQKFVLDDDIRLTGDANVLQVRKVPKPGQFGSLAAACASLVGVATEESQWLIDVGPGSYTEPMIVVPSFVHISGFSEYAVYVRPNNNTDPIFAPETASTISFINVTGATGPAQYAFQLYDTGMYGVLLHKVCLFGNTNGFDIKALTVDSTVYLEYCDTEQDGGIGVNVDSSSATYSAYVNLENFYVYGSDANPEIGVSAVGPRVYVNIQSFNMEGVDGTGDAFHQGNGSRIDAKAGSIFGWDVGCHLDNNGTAPIGNYVGVSLHGNETWDIHAEHPGALGTLSGTADRAKVNAAAAPGFTFAFADSESNEYIQTGDFYMGATGATLTNVTGLIIDTPPMGLLAGGTLTGTGGLGISVQAGSGYLRKDGAVTLVSWNTTPLTITAGTSPYVFVNKNGVVSTSSMEPDGFTNIILGRAGANASVVYSLGNLDINIANYGNKVENYLRKAIGTVYVSGSMVTENATTPRAIDVTAGQWMYGTKIRNPSAKTAPTIQDIYKSGGVITFTPRNTVPNDTYDDGTNLVSITPGYFVKHVLYQSAEGAYQSYSLGHAQAEYATLQEAINAPLPTPLIPPDATPRIAALVMQEGVNSIVEIIDIRPMFFRDGGVATGAGGGVSDHGDLMGLDDDDHLQYLLASGTRAMAGDLNLGSNDITNVGLIDGLDIAAHASRHQPNGADPLSTGPGVGIGPASVNGTGTSNLLSRADHTHALFGVQPASTELTQVAALNTNGIVVHVEPNVWTTRSITSSSGSLLITNPAGIAGNIDINFAPVGTPGTYYAVTTDENGSVISGTQQVPFSALTGLPSTLAAHGITDAQPLDADLTALANSAGTGFYIRTGNGTSVTRTFVAPAAGLTITNPDGVAGDITLALANDLAAIEALSTPGIPVRTGSDTWAIRTLTQPAAGMTITNPAGTAGNFTFALANDLLALENLTTVGIGVRTTAAGAWATRQLSSTNLTITNGTGATAADITVNLPNVGSAGTYRSVTTDATGRVTAGTNPTTLAGYGITDAINVSEKGAPNGVATLDGTGKLPVAQLPALAITDSFVVSNEAAMLGLTAEVGDIAIRTDLSKTFILQAVPASTLANWKELATPTDTVTSVNGQTGAVALNFVTSVATSQPAAGLTITGGPITSTGTLTFTLANDLAALEGLGATGFAVRSAADTWVQRNITAGTGIGVTNGDGVAGSPTISLTNVGTAGTYRSVTTDAQGRVTAGTNPTTLAGYGITDAQPLDSDLTALANIASTGLYVITGTGSSTTRSFVAGSGISITNGSCVAGNVTIANTGVLAATLTQPAAGFSITSGGTATNPTYTFALTNDLAAVEGLSGTGLAVRTAADTWTNRSIAVGTGLSILNADGVAGNPTISISGANTAASGLLSSWTLVSGIRYRADFAHNLGTNNVVITLYDTADNSVVTADSVVLTDTNTVRVTVVGNTRTLRIVVVANGLAVNTGTMSAGTITTAKDSVNVSTAASRLNFTGQAVSVTDAGAGTTNVMIGSRYTYFATALDSPVSNDWAINAFAPTVVDPSFSSLTVRQFSNTTEQGVGMLISIPGGATTATFRFRGRPQTSVAGATNVVAMRLYSRWVGGTIVAGAAGWQAVREIGETPVPASNTQVIYSGFTIPLSTLNLSAGGLYQLELTRRVAGTTGTNYAGNYLLYEVSVELA